MLRYYYKHNLKETNHYIIKNEIIPQIKKANTQKNDFFILTPNYLYLQNLKKILLEECGTIKVSSLMTIKAFYDEILTKILTTTTALRNYAIINEINKNILMKEVINKYKNQEKYLKNILNINSFQKELIYIINAIKKEGKKQNKHIIDINEDFNQWKKQVTEEYPNLTDKYNAINKIINNYAEKQKEYSLIDNQDIIHIIKNTLKQDTISLIETKTIYLFNIISLSTLEIKLLEKLSELGINITITLYFDPKRIKLFHKGNKLIEKLKEINFKEKTLPANTEVKPIEEIKNLLFTEEMHSIKDDYPMYKIKGENPKDEVIEVARQVNNIIKEGNKPSQIAIIDRKPAVYQDYVYDILKQYKIPLGDFHQKKLVSKQIIQVILNIIELKIYNFRRDILLPFISSSYTYINKELIKKELPNYNANKIVQNIIYYCNNPNKDIFLHLEKLIEKASKEENKHKEKKLKECLLYLNKLKEIISLLENKNYIYDFIKTLKQQVNNSFSILYNTYNNKELEIIKEDALTLKHFFHLLDELSFIHTKKGNQKININKFYELLKETILSYSFHNKRTNINAIHYSKPENIIGLSFKYIFVIGMTEGNFPQKLWQSTLFSNPEKRIINKITKLTFPNADEQIDDEDLTLLNTINTAEKKVFLSYPIRNNKLQETLASFYFDEIKTKEVKHKNEINSVSELLEYYGKIALENNKDLGTKLIPKNIKSIIHSKVEMEHCRDDKNNFGKYEGILYNKKIHSLDIIKNKLNNKLTASQIERYGQCPHRFFFYDIIGLRKKEDFTEDELDPSSKGIAAHYILYKFYKNNTSPDKNECLNKDGTLKKEVKNNIIEIAKKYFDKQTEERKLTNLYNNTREINEIINKILIFIRNDILYNDDYKRELLELDFNSKENGIPLIKYKGKDIHIKGTIDRIDIEKEKNKDNTLFRIIDYKYKSSSNKESSKTIKEKLRQGIYFQPIIYSKIAIDILKDYKLEKWYYYYIDLNKISKRKSKTQPSAVEVDVFDTTEESQKENYMTRGFYYINKYLDLTQKGRFPVNPRDCSDYCEFKEACRVNIPLSEQKEKNTMFWKNIIHNDTED